MNIKRGYTVNELYKETAWTMERGRRQPSRVGPVVSIIDPVYLELLDPRARVLIAPKRRPNPVFHLMEAIWMLGGGQYVDWLTQFNKGIEQYAEEDGSIHGAYGHRWRNHFGLDQLTICAKLLIDDPNTRQAMLSMWSPWDDLGATVNDRPCNTHIYFRVVSGHLHMTVCNRSNDMFWGMFGSNIVHMTMLHEWMALTCGFELGKYRVMTNNLHVYTELYPGAEYVLEAKWLESPILHPHLPILQGTENGKMFLEDCERFIENDRDIRCRWFDDVARPMKYWWENRTNVTNIMDLNWREACLMWEKTSPKNTPVTESESKPELSQSSPQEV